ncbi:MAG: sensor histidine kinase [Gemmatimonas sp.]
MRLNRAWGIATLVFAAVVGALVATWIVDDRAQALRNVEERTQSIARMIAAHADAAINDASLIVSSVEDDVARWDLRDPVAGRRIFERLRDLAAKTPVVSSAWVVDAGGTSRLDTWTFPARPIDATGRSYYQKHVAGAANPVIAADTTPGTITGLPRFTLSKALRNPDGSIHAIIVVGIWSEVFDTLYNEVATWPEARAGLYASGEILARLRTQPQASDEFIGEVYRRVQSSDSGWAQVPDGEAMRLVSWQRAKTFPAVYGTSSQGVKAALAEWRIRSIAVGAAALVLIGLFALFAATNARAMQARQQALLNEAAAREAHHRVKNSLHLMVSLIGLQSRATTDTGTRRALEETATRIHAIADVHDLLQKGPEIGRIDVSALLQQLCAFVRFGYDGEVRFVSNAAPHLDAKQATSVGIIVNELITNAMKSARRVVAVSTGGDARHFAVEVADDGPGLPEKFDLRDRNSFGLRAAMLMVDSIGADLAVVRTGETGTTFRLTVPLRPSSPDRRPASSGATAT